MENDIVEGYGKKRGGKGRWQFEYRLRNSAYVAIYMHANQLQPPTTCTHNNRNTLEAREQKVSFTYNNHPSQS